MKYMEYPVLFEKSTDDFTTQGIGILTDCLSVEVTNEFNEFPELSLSYLADGDIAKELVKGRIIVSDVGDDYLQQRFRIDTVQKSMDNKIDVTATHILNDLTYNALKSDVHSQGVRPVIAFDYFKRNLEQPEPNLEMKSSIIRSAPINWTMDVVDNAKKALGGVEGSLLDLYKGDYLFDNNTIHYEYNIGRKTGKVIEYGKDLIQVKQDENISDTYTAIKPFAKLQGSGENEQIIYLPERIIKSDNADKFEKLRILTKDFSQDKVSTADQLRTSAQYYMEQNNFGVPKVTLEFEMEDIKDDLGFVDDLNMGDSVTVHFANLTIDTKARVIKTVWDGLLHRYKTVTIGDKAYTSADYQNEQNASTSEINDDIKAKMNNIRSDLRDYKEHYDDIQQQVNEARDDIFHFIKDGSTAVIRFSPNREYPTAMYIDSNAGSSFLLNGNGIYYQGTGKTAMDSRGNIYADNFVGQKISGVQIEAADIHGGNISGDVGINLSGASGNVFSVTSYGISAPSATIHRLDGGIYFSTQTLNVDGTATMETATMGTATARSLKVSGNTTLGNAQISSINNVSGMSFRNGGYIWLGGVKLEDGGNGKLKIGDYYYG